METSGEGNFSVSMNTSSSAPFQEERLGLGLYVGDCTCKNSNRDARPVFLGFKSFFLGGSLENWRYVLGYVKLGLQEQFFTRDCNVILKRLLHCHREENLQHGYTSTIFLQLFRRRCIASARQAKHRNLCMRRQCNNLLKLHCHHE